MLVESGGEEERSSFLGGAPALECAREAERRAAERLKLHQIHTCFTPLPCRSSLHTSLPLSLCSTSRPCLSSAHCLEGRSPILPPQQRVKIIRHDIHKARQDRVAARHTQVGPRLVDQLPIANRARELEVPLEVLYRAGIVILCVVEDTQRAAGLGLGGELAGGLGELEVALHVGEGGLRVL